MKIIPRWGMGKKKKKSKNSHFVKRKNLFQCAGRGDVPAGVRAGGRG